jgi:hypothetical protein
MMGGTPIQPQTDDAIAASSLLAGGLWHDTRQAVTAPFPYRSVA